MATHSSILAWKIPWTEEPGGLQSTGLQSWTRLSDCHLAVAGLHCCLWTFSSCGDRGLPFAVMRGLPLKCRLFLQSTDPREQGLQ